MQIIYHYSGKTGLKPYHTQHEAAAHLPCNAKHTMELPLDLGSPVLDANSEVTTTSFLHCCYFPDAAHTSMSLLISL